jgi:Flp pilus assembly pilin Flp
MLRQLLQDEAGFIVSAELVLVATILVIGLIVGMSQIQYAVVEEMNDVAKAIGSLNQTYYYTGFSATKAGGATKSVTTGSFFKDEPDACDTNCADISCDQPVPECGGFFAP